MNLSCKQRTKEKTFLPSFYAFVTANGVLTALLTNRYRQRANIHQYLEHHQENEIRKRGDVILVKK